MELPDSGAAAACGAMIGYTDKEATMLTRQIVLLPPALLSIACAVHPNAVPPPAPVPKGTSFTVRVTDSNTHSPIGNATVTLRAATSADVAPVVMTDRAGVARLGAVSAGAIHLTVSASGFSTAELDSTVLAGATAVVCSLSLSKGSASVDLGFVPALPQSEESISVEAVPPLEERVDVAETAPDEHVEVGRSFYEVFASGESEGVMGGVEGGVEGGAAVELAIVSKPSSASIDPGSGESYSHRDDSPFRSTRLEPLSTFSIDVDTASYSNLRRFLNQGSLPPADAVRIEELLNYFDYDDPEPNGTEPVAVHAELSPCPWRAIHKLLRVGVKGVPARFLDRRPGNYVFLIDVSGSMDEPDKLPLVRHAMKRFAEQLLPEDRVSIVTYAGAAGLVLAPTSASRRGLIDAAIDVMKAGGSTAGGEGILLAYEIARQNFITGGNNRVILATDGDFNVGVSSEGELVRLIEEKRKSGVFLTVIGVGEGNLNDSMMEQLADHGNGQYLYIDTEREVERALVERGLGVLSAVAKDMKIQIEFNPLAVGSYRLIGYENRVLAAADFKNDAKDAGEVGAGQSVTALYELAAPGEALPGLDVDPLRYQTERTSIAQYSAELGTIKWRYKLPDGDSSVERSLTLGNDDGSWSAPGTEIGFAAAVATFGMVLRNSPERGDASFGLAASLAAASLGRDPDGARREFLALVNKAKSLAAGSDVVRR